MKLIGMMPCRSEAWCVGMSVRVALQWVDELIFLDHCSTDRSRDIVSDLMREFPNRITDLVEQDSKWNEMAMRQRMLEMARDQGATHLSIIDCDEILSANVVAAARSYIETAPANSISQWPGYNLRGGLNRYHSNGIWGNRFFSVAFKDWPTAHWGGDTFHQREPRGGKLDPYRPIAQGQGGILHLWAASERRLVAKHALYKVTERLRWPEKKIAEIERTYNWAIKGDPTVPAYGTPDTWTYAETPEAWLAGYKNLLQYIDIHAAPWQETEVRRLVALHGKEAFQGLDLFGVA